MLMRKFTSLFTLICAMFITTATAQVNQTVVFNFSNGSWDIGTLEENNYSGYKNITEHTDGTLTITISPRQEKNNNGSYSYDCRGFVQLGKPGSKIILPAFNFAVEKIEVIGHAEGGKDYPNVDMNIYVGSTAVSTACTGTTETYTYEIAADNQAAGNVYELVIGSKGGNYSSVMCISCIKVYPAASENALRMVDPILDMAPGVYTGPITVKVSSPTAEIEGVEKVTYYYTTDGYEPDSECDEIEDGEITISKTCTLKVVLEIKYEGEYYTSAPSSAKYIISEEVTCEKATTVTTGNYFIAVNGNIALPFYNGVLPTKETNVEDNKVTDAEYYAYTIEDAGNGKFYIKDANNLYIYASIGSKDEIKASNNSQNTDWEITIEDGVAKIRKEIYDGQNYIRYVLVYRENNIVAVKEEAVTETEIYPSLYSVPAPQTAIEGVNAETQQNAEIYDLTGRRIDEIVKPGIYIVGGKKVLVK